MKIIILIFISLTMHNLSKCSTVVNDVTNDAEDIVQNINGSLTTYVNQSQHPVDFRNCSKEEFERVFLGNKVYMSERQLKNLFKRCPVTNMTCGKAGMSMILQIDENAKNLYTLFKWQNMFVNKNKDCWGYLVEIMAGKNIRRFGFFGTNYNPNQLHAEVMENIPAMTYEAKIISIPTMIKAIVANKSPGLCETQILLKIHKEYEAFYTNSDCERANEIQQKRHVAEQICEKYPDSPKKQNEELVHLKFENCVLYIEHQSRSNGIFIIAIVIATLFILCIAIFIKMKTGKSLLYKCKKKFSEKDSQLLNQRKPAKSLLILYPHGCEILHQILRTLATLISSYGIKVNLSLLESTKIDAKGGISKFYEEHIVNCDYILIVCTDTSDPASCQHKPFMFAISMLNGHAFSNNDSSSYIPLYISSFDKIKEFIPKFLLIHNKSHEGFQIPSDINRLIKHLLIQEEVSLPRDLQNKNNVQMNCLKHLASQYLKSVHGKCHRRECKKGDLGTQVSFASSLFSSMKTMGGEETTFERIYDNMAMSRTVFLSRSHSLDTLC